MTKKFHERDKGQMGKKIDRKKISLKSGRQYQPLCKRRMEREIVIKQTTEMEKNTEWKTEMKISLIIIDEKEQLKGRGFM